MQALIDAVKQYALKHYEIDGWDYIIETQTDNDILSLIDGATTEDQAIANVHWICKLWKDQENEFPQ